jgi:ferredoxin-like protein FixX
MKQFLRRQPMEPYMTEAFHAEMHKIENCLECGSCRANARTGWIRPTCLRKI